MAPSDLIKPRLTPSAPQVTGLSACEDYLLLVAVVGPSGTGLPSPLGRVRTQFDIRAPPKNVTVAARRGLSLVMRVHWAASCRQVQRPVTYNGSNTATTGCNGSDTATSGCNGCLGGWSLTMADIT